MNEVEGRPGELLDRLIELLNSDELGNDEWYNVSSWATYFVGGQTLRNVVPDTGPPMPGSVGEMRRQQHAVVSREEYFELIRERLGDLVADGLEEAFLVRSVRDAVRAMLESMADVGKGDRNREEMRTLLEQQAEDPAAIAAFRAMLAERNPSAETLSDEEVAARLRDMARLPHLQPTSPEEATQKWTVLTRWDQQAASLLPDAVFDEWRLRRPKG
jgi:hypothetical protein